MNQLHTVDVNDRVPQFTQQSTVDENLPPGL